MSNHLPEVERVMEAGLDGVPPFRKLGVQTGIQRALAVLREDVSVILDRYENGDTTVYPEVDAAVERVKQALGIGKNPASPNAASDQEAGR